MSAVTPPVFLPPNCSSTFPCPMKKHKRPNSKSVKSGKVSIETNDKSQSFLLKINLLILTHPPHKKTTSLSRNSSTHVSIRYFYHLSKIILSDDHQLRENLIELIDHRVIIEEIDKTKNKKVFIMKLDRRILENMIQGKYDNYDFENGT